jgi:hypothetical protein
VTNTPEIAECEWIERAYTEEDCRRRRLSAIIALVAHDPDDFPQERDSHGLVCQWQRRGCAKYSRVIVGVRSATAVEANEVIGTAMSGSM